MLASSAAIGCYFGLSKGGQRSALDYLMGGRQMSMLPVALSLVASFISGISIMGDPAEVYRHGTQYWTIVLSSYLASCVVSLVYAPLYIKLQLNSCYQYLKMRFNESVRKMASALFVISQFLYIPIVIYAPALALSQVTGLNVHVITPVISAICIFYTTIGGLRAVVWTDTLQTCLMMMAMVAVFAMGVARVGGWEHVWQAAERGGRLEFFNMDPNPLERHTFWTVLLGQFVYQLAWCATSQGMVQRYLAVPDLRTARWCLACFAFGMTAVKWLSVATGLLLYASYENCDPISSQRVSRQDQILPLYVLETAGHIPGLSGLFVAGVFSAALSSMSTGLNALSGVLVEDLFARWIPKEGRFGAALWLRVAALSTGVVCVVLVLIVEHLGGVLQVALSLGSITSGTMLGLFTMGMFCPRANSKGALIGSLASLILNGGIVFATQGALAQGTLRHSFLPLSTDLCPENTTTIILPTEPVLETWPLLKLSYMYYSLVGAILVPLVGLPVSWISGGRHRKMSPDLFSPFVHRWLTPEDQQCDLKLDEK
ncbi:sodium-coupled monocarboxylate transporter 1-like isoform X2 [Neocloeon triangulifer]|nr:sodium-coupled monocarboxylate transporter 1-like isoform X2 [Neocloeon triangulifer]